jgi:hypothetical protein
MNNNRFTEIELLIWIIENRSSDLLADDIEEEIADLLGLFRYQSTLSLALDLAAVHFENDTHCLRVINAYREEMTHENQ